MGYQFIHMESYARKPDAKGRGADFIFAEASRKPEACVHVSAPTSPIIVHGVGVEAVQELHDSAVISATVEVKGGKSRKIRQDQKTVHTVVASHPYTMDEIRTDPTKRREAEEWQRRTVAWLRDQYGDDLKSVIRHEDESHWHIHAYILPLSDPAFKAARYHPGMAAKRVVMDAGPIAGEDHKALGTRADAEYKAAMRQWQDSYHEAVAIPSGLTRLGPQRRRLSRDEWQREQVQAKALQNVVRQARKIKTDGEAYVQRTKSETAKIAADAARAQEAARKAVTAAQAVQDHARQDQEQAQAAMADAARYGGWTGRLRAVWDGLRKSRLVEKVRAEFSSEIDRWRDVAQTAERRQLEAERQRHEAEKKARQAQDAAFRAGIERDRLRSMLAPSADPAPEPSHSPKLELKPNFQKKEKRNA